MKLLFCLSISSEKVFKAHTCNIFLLGLYYLNSIILEPPISMHIVSIAALLMIMMIAMAGCAGVCIFHRRKKLQKYQKVSLPLKTKEVVTEHLTHL